MQTPLARRKMLVDMGLAEAIPSLDTQRAWCWIDNRKPPEGEEDGRFDSFASWVNHAASWIGWRGSSCFDALDRPCRIGRDFMRARDEGAFPVRWYWPSHYPKPVVVDPRIMRIRVAVAAASPVGVAIEELRTYDRLGNVGRAEALRAIAGREMDAEEGRLAMTEEGMLLTAFEADCQHRAACVRN